MRDRLTPLQHAICNALHGESSLTPEQVYERLDLLRPDVADRSVAMAVRIAVSRGLERLVEDGLLARRGTDAAPAYAIASDDRLGARLAQQPI